MHTETLGHYEVELSARQLIHNGGWAAFAAIHELAEDTRGAEEAGFAWQHLADETVYASEAAALAGARAVALAFLKPGNPQP
ncbi:hypothetical protein [Paraburkholderia ferrariae]|uniref:hypothetical protein n=1 Tax=Paraburkholderia ferrariae TaxID=386056 RepID=UPI000481955E|nr:hypothetical protein [Paraburkholderia ferrariae]